MQAPSLEFQRTDSEGQIITGYYEFKTKPFDHQLEEWYISRDMIARAILWEQGTGKSKLTIDTACWLYLQGKIDAVLVVAPNGVHRNWVEDEIPEHVPTSLINTVRAFPYQSQRADTKWHSKALKQTLEHPGFAWLTISYEAFITKRGKDAVKNFLHKRRVLYVLDEAQGIKTPSAKRTMSIVRSGAFADHKRILTGTPISTGPFDLYSEIRFLQQNYWKHRDLSTFTEYKQHFGVFIKKRRLDPHLDPKTGKMEDYRYWDELVQYRRLDQLQEMIAPIVSRKTKDDVLDLPEKLYTKRYIELTPEQRKLYRKMEEECMVWLYSDEAQQETELFQLDQVCATCGGAKEILDQGYVYPCPDCFTPDSTDEGDILVVAPLAITRLLRLQQIICGYLPTEEEQPIHRLPGKNPRLEALMEVIEEAGHKVIVWARFVADIDLILEECAARGINAVRYDGQINDDQKAESKALFKGARPIYENGQMVGKEQIPEEEQARVFVGNPQAGATGLTLTEAKTVVYYSNSYKLIDRLQSEDRAHRIGQENQVLYVDLIARETVDERIVESLKNKFDIASQILGDKLKEWIQ